MRYSALNINKDVDYWQGNNIFELENPDGYDQCGVEALAAGRAALIPFPDKNRNPYGGDWEIQEGDYLAAFFKDPRNWKDFQKIRNLDYKKIPPQQIPQLHPCGLLEVFGMQSKYFEGTNFDMIIRELKAGNVVELCLIKSNPNNPKSSGHYILANQYDDLTDNISFKDPAKDMVKWKSETLDSDGNKWFARRDYLNNVHKWHVVIYKPK